MDIMEKDSLGFSLRGSSHVGNRGIRIKLPIFLKSPLSDFFFFNVLGYQDPSYFVCSL